MKKKYFKILSLFLSFSTVFTSIQSSYAYNMENNDSVEMIEYQNSSDEDFSSSLNVFAELSSIYKVTIPKTVVLSGESKDATYFVKVEGDIAGYEQISVIPDESFNLYTKKKDPQKAFVSQDKTIWHVSDFGIDANGTIKANTITAGKWSGVFYFNINLEDGEKVAGDIIIPPDLPLDDDYRLIIEKISDAPGLYDDNFTLILPWPEIAKRIEGGETISQIVNSCPGGVYLSIPQGTSTIPTNYLPETNIKYIYVPDTVTTIQTTSCPGSPIKGVFLPKSTKVEPGAFDNTPAGENKQVYVGGQRIVDTVININELPEREEDIKDENALILEKGCKYQITALYNFYDDVTKQSTIKSSNPDIVKFIPDCTLEALEVGTSIISGKFFGPLGERNAYLLVKVIDTGYSKGSVPSNTHKHVVGPLQEENEVLATCTKDGHVDQVFYCSDCNKELGRRTIPIYATGHVAGEWVIVKEATEIETGLKEQRCTVCDELLKSETIEKLPNTDKHTDVKYVYKNKIEPTCTKNGSQDKIAICNVCGKEVEKITEILPATGHTKGEYKIVKNATCSEKGLKEQRCTVCDELLDSEEIPMTQHIEKSAVKENEVPATCTKDGSYDEVVYCSVCNAEISRTVVKIPALGHDYKETVISPTHKEKGYTLHTCSRCGDTYKDNETAVVAHVYDNGKITKNATCTEDGIKTYTCSCGDTKTEVIKATGHKAGTAVRENEKAATCTATGSYDEVVYCSVCKSEISRTKKTIPALGHDYVATVTAPTHTTKGYTTHTCSRCGDTYKDTETNVIAHTYDSGKVTKEATCTTDGVKTYTCTGCSATKTEVIAKLGHDYVTTVIAPTCTTDGYTKHTCSRCDNSYNDTTVTKLGHNYVEGTCTRCGDTLPALSVSASGFTGNYDGKAHSITVTSSGNTIQYSTDNKTWSATNPTYTNAGTYTVYYKVSKDGYKTVTGNQKVVINKIASTLNAAPTAKTGLVYTGSAQPLVNTGTATNGTVQYKLGTGSYGTTIPTATNAGTYTVYYKVVGNTNYNDVAEKSVNVTINKANPTVTAPTAKSLTYTGSAQTLINAGKTTAGTIQYKLNSNGTYGTAIPTATNAGTYTVYYKVIGNSNYNDVAEKTVSVTINNAASSVKTAPTTKTGLVYNGSAQQLINAGTANNGTMQYKVGTGSYGTAIPTATNAGTYTVYYKVVGNTNYGGVGEKSFTVTIAKANSTLSKAPTAKSLTYTGSAQALVNAGTATNGTIQYKLGTGSYSTSIPTATNPGTYTVYYKVVGNTNYNDVTEKSLTVTIAKKTPTVTAPTAKSLTYTGSAQALVNAGSTNAGTLQYKLNSNGTYGTTIPTATNAGTYTVYYKVVGNANYADVAEKSISITIAKKAADGTRPSAKTLTFNNANQALINAGSCTTGKIQYSTDNKTWSTTIPQGKDAKTYTVYYKIDSTNNNYNSVSSTKLSPVINKAAGYINTKPTAKSLKYTGSAQALVNAGSNASGTIQYSLNNSSWSTSIPTGKDAKTYTVYYKVDASTNYNAVNSASISVTINKGAIADSSVTAPTGKSLTYTGSAQALVNAGKTSIGTMQYRLGTSGSYSTTIPTATAIGTYTIYYKVVGNNNYSDTTEKSVTTTIKENVTEVSLNHDIIKKMGYTIGADKQNNYTLYKDGKQVDNFVIPETYTYSGSKYKVTRIISLRLDNITSVTIPSSVKKIDSGFYLCHNLKSITIPNSVTTIGSCCFVGLTECETINIPASVTSIDEYNFGGATKLKSINVDANNKNYKSINGAIFTKDGKTMLGYPAGKTDTTYSIPSGTERIAQRAFLSHNLTTINIPASVTEIVSVAYFDSDKITAINVDANNKNYKSIDGVLFSKDGTILYYYPKGKTATSYTVPNGVKTIFSNAFNGNKNLTTVNLPNSLVNINNSAFSDSNITTMTIPSSVKFIAYNAFGGCKGGSGLVMATKTGWYRKKSESDTTKETLKTMSVPCGSSYCYYYYYHD